MKKNLKILALAAGLVVAAVTTNAQGTYNFLTFNSDTTLGSVSLSGGALAGVGFSGQIYGGAAGSDPSTWVAFGAASPFIDSGGNSTGVINGGQMTVASIAGATSVDVVLRAWDDASGDYATAVTSGTSGQSGVFTVTLGGGGPPPLADPNMNGFANLTMTTVPEPSVIVLGLAGAGLLWFRRKS